ncbi:MULTISPECIES: helix-turn-helix transcriptional regulator [Methylobacterium]|uniref:helix-turn-helix transcriptional regulator n=1 Tax=Methylobacterium TaxID=407 RepID=UPI0011140DE5|nr:MULTISPECIES: helix-turn-helix transcriptional regulator [Methylobacterium]MBK3399678.1 helix-turn-helix transcriptional regulator [Methylobacterium ajmalii]MBK3407130.1 helix-turn-helix transcriptional regulator [Methylobacterium ajmalii]
MSEEIGLAIDHAACDPGAWDGVMATIGRLMPGIWPVLQVVDAAAGTGLPLVHWGWDPADVAAYEAHYGAVNPWISVILSTPEMVSMHSEERMPAATLHHTEFYTDWLSRLGGMTASSGIKLLDADGRLAVLNLQHEQARAAREQGRLGEVMARIGPRMRRAIETNRACFSPGAARGPGETLLERVADPAFVVTRDLRLVEASRAGHDLLAEGTVLRVGALDRVQVRDPRLAETVAREVALACGGVPGPAVLPATQGPVRIGATRWQVTAIGLRQDLRGVVGMARLLVPDQLALVVLRGSAADEARERDRLAALGLSPAETRLALLMDGSRSLVQAAEALGIRHETARSQLRQVFAKLGVSRQSELAVFVLRLRQRA